VFVKSQDYLNVENASVNSDDSKEEIGNNIGAGAGKKYSEDDESANVILDN